MRKERIALVCTSLNELGGKNNHLKNLYHGLKDEYQVRIVVTSKVEKALRMFMESNGVSPSDLIFFPRWQKWFLLPLIFSLSRAFKREEIDIVHTFQIQSDVFGAVAARIARVKNIYSYYESKFIPENISPFKKILYKAVNKLVKNIFKKTVVVSHGLAREIEQSRFRPHGTVEVIHLGFDVPLSYRGKKYDFENLKKGTPCVGTIARLSFEKALDRFVRAMPFVIKAVPGASFMIMGSGPEEEALKQQVQSIFLDGKVTFLPWGEDIYSTLENIDIFVMPSIREGCPTALLEACALSRPVVASKIEGISDIVEDRIQGLLVDTADVDSFSHAVISLCQNPIKAIGIGRRASQRVVSEFSKEKEMEKNKALYR